MFQSSNLCHKFAGLRGLIVLLLWLVLPRPASSYSFQTHEQLIDLTWTDSIKPLLKRRFPNLTEAELLQAHAYAYGGSAIQDLGYYPVANGFFSDLTHYVRSAEFVRSLFRHARNANELAFAIGALSHYVGDTIGHSDAINPAVAIEFPKLKAKFGPSVNYGEGPHAHVRAEFAFDIDQITLHHMAPSAYLRHVGLQIPYALLSQAFSETYGSPLRAVLGGRRPIIRTYRFAIRSFLPLVAYAEAVLHRNDFPPEPNTDAARRFQAQLARTEFETGWNQFRKKPGFRTYVLAGVIFVVPKIGRLSELSIRGPELSTLERYLESVNRSTASMRNLLGHLDGTLRLPNRDLDTGDRVKPGGYRLTDETYAKLLNEITKSSSVQELPATLKENLLDYYADPNAPIATKKDRKRWARVQNNLALLQGMKARPEPGED
ncbi:MAG: zinc dependent phospholipase C family protein [Bryobacteraceae bacterium]